MAFYLNKNLLKGQYCILCVIFYLYWEACFCQALVFAMFYLTILTDFLCDVITQLCYKVRIARCKLCKNLGKFPKIPESFENFETFRNFFQP